MTKIIPIADIRKITAAPLPRVDYTPGRPVADTFGRALRDLRISITDRCNFRCSYCMPRDQFGSDHAFLPHDQILSFEEITRLARLFAQLGVNKLRITGGEPLLRKEMTRLIGMLAQIRDLEGKPLDIALTTNGTLLQRMAGPLRDAGLQRITVSLDALDPQLFATMSDSKVHVDQVLAGIEAARSAGIEPVKVNMVVKRGVNEHQILPMADYFRHSGHILRFIEFMDVGATNHWDMTDVVSGREILEILQSKFDLEAVHANYPGEVARRWRYKDRAGEVGLITSVTNAFCGDCTRLRLSPEGKLFTCLFAESGSDLRELLRSPASDHDIAGVLAGIWSGRNDRYSEQRDQLHDRREKIEMSYIGG